MQQEKGIRFPGPNEVLTDVPPFDNAGDAITWFNRLTAAQIRSIKDVRINLPSMNFDSLEKTTTSSALQQVFKKVKSGGEGIEEWVGARKGGMIASKPAPHDWRSACGGTWPWRFLIKTPSS